MHSGSLLFKNSSLNTDSKRSVISFLDGIKGYFIKHNVCSSVVISSSTSDNIVYPTIKISRSVIGSQFLAHASFKQMARFGTEYCDGQALIIYPEDSLYKSRVQYSARHSSSYEFVTGYYDDDYIYIRFANPKGFIKIEISVCTQFYWYDPETFDWLNENVSVTYMKDVTGFTQMPLTVL